METVNQKPPLRVVVFADSYLAQPVFEALLAGGWVAGLCTSRRRTMSASLRHLAGVAGVPVIETDRHILTESLPNRLAKLAPDVLLTISYPYKLPPEILSIPKLGAYNIHSGKLPEYRGPQPVFWEILNREPEGALYVHRMDEEYDRGAVIASLPVALAPEDTYGLHCVRLAFAAVGLVEFLFRAIVRCGADIPALAQDESRAVFYARPAPKDLIIDWEKQSGGEIRALVKACNPWNQGAHTAIKGINVRLADVTLIPGEGDQRLAPGSILTANEIVGLRINCLDDSALQLDVVSMDEGLLPGRTLVKFGMQQGDKFDTLRI